MRNTRERAIIRTRLRVPCKRARESLFFSPLDFLLLILNFSSRPLCVLCVLSSAGLHFITEQFFICFNFFFALL